MFARHATARSAGPLRVQSGLRPLERGRQFRCREHPLDGRRTGIAGLGPVRIREVAGLSAAGLIDHVDGPALADEVRRPAGTPVRCAEEICARLLASVNHHDRIPAGGIPVPLVAARDLVKHVHLAGHRRRGGRVVVRASHVQDTLMRDGEGTEWFDSRCTCQPEQAGGKRDCHGMPGAKRFDAFHCLLPFWSGFSPLRPRRLCFQRTQE